MCSNICELTGQIVCKHMSWNQSSKWILGREEEFRAWIFPLKAQGLNNLVRDINMLHDFFRILMFLIFCRNFVIVFFGIVNVVKQKDFMIDSLMFVCLYTTHTFFSRLYNANRDVNIAARACCVPCTFLSRKQRACRELPCAFLSWYYNSFPNIFLQFLPWARFFDQFQWNHLGIIQDFERVLPTLFPNFHACQKVFIALDMKTNVAHKVTSIRFHQNNVIPIDE